MQRGIIHPCRNGAAITGEANLNKYQNFQILIANGDWTKWIDVCAVDIFAAKSDIEQACVGCKVIQWQSK